MVTAVPRPPSIDSLARSLADLGLPHPLLVDAARRAVAAGEPGSARSIAGELAAGLLQPAVNATGILLHTNLGRAPVAVSQDGRASTVELDLRTGRRGRRGGALAGLIGRLTGAEGAVVVNNGAAAVLLVLATLAAGRSVVVSRGELVEIGGGFRIPDVLVQSGARLVEVGTTNRTRLADYAAAVERDDPAVILKVHQSNYKMVGFTESVTVADLARLGVPVVVDLGSGLLDATTPWLAGGPPPWLRGEPAARQTLADGASLVTFSDDKLLGGPQAGIVAGAADLVEACARHPLARAVRPGGLVLGALQQTLLALLGRDLDAVPLWKMMSADTADVRRRAEQVAAAVGPAATAVDCVAGAGGGSLPGVEIPSAGVSVAGDLTTALRRHQPPVIAAARSGRTVCDLRSVDPADDPVIVSALTLAVSGRRGLGAADPARPGAPPHTAGSRGTGDAGPRALVVSDAAAHFQRPEDPAHSQPLEDPAHSRPPEDPPHSQRPEDVAVVAEPER